MRTRSIVLVLVVVVLLLALGIALTSDRGASDWLIETLHGPQRPAGH